MTLIFLTCSCFETIAMFFRNKSTDTTNQQTGDEPGTSSHRQASSASTRRAESSPESIDSRSVYGGGRHALRDDDEEDENIANRIFISRSSTEFSRLLHAVNPKAFEKGSEKYAMASYKVPPPFCKECNFNIGNDGLTGALNFKWPEGCCCPRVILGHASLSSTNPFYQATMSELNRVTGHSDNRSKFKLGVNLPFKCETKTTPDITTSGQRADLVPVDPKLGDIPENYAGNVAFFVKKAHQNFAVTTRGTVQKSYNGLLIDDNQDGNNGNEEAEEEIQDVEMAYPQTVPTSNALVRQRVIKRPRGTEDDADI